MKYSNRTNRESGGFSLLEVLVGIAIFAIGMLALAHLQGNLTRSVADANVRTVATNIAEEFIEYQRGFGLISTDPDGLIFAYNDITDDQTSIARGGINYSLTQDVEGYYWVRTLGRFVDTADYTANNYGSAAIPDFKFLTVTVSWDDQRSFNIDEGADISSVDIGTGSITIQDIIHSSTSAANSKPMEEPEKSVFAPFVDYEPGQNPDIISLRLGDNKFKESLTPQPDVFRQDELVQTQFDVITYSQSDSGSLFLRREEFVAVSCGCSLAAPAENNKGRRPALWAGDEYIEPELIQKPYGTAQKLAQSSLCETCCRDHHDGGSGADDPVGDEHAILYQPARSKEDYFADGTFAGDHKHYNRDRRGDWVLAATAGDHYHESCTLVRKDGFFKVIQDMRQEGMNVFPQDFLDQVSEVEVYSGYVTKAVNELEESMSDGYPASPPTLVPAPTGTEAGDLWTDRTEIPTLISETQQLRSRGVYVNYLSDDLRDVIDCLRTRDPDATDPQDCDSGNVKLDKTGSGNVLELIPFFDVQLTWLSRWGEMPANNPVDTTNEPLLTNNQHSRGIAFRGGAAGNSEVRPAGHRGNLGLTDTDPIDPNFDSMVVSAMINVYARSDNPPRPPGTLIIEGKIVSGVNGFVASTVDISSIDAMCNRTPDGFLCDITNASAPEIKVRNYVKPNTKLVACSTTLIKTNSSDTAGNPTTTFSLKGADPEVVHVISIQQDACL